MCDRTVNTRQPIFAHFGIEGGVNAAVFFNLRHSREPVVVVGTYNGNCIIYSLRSFKRLATAYEDPQTRQVIALGEYGPHDSDGRTFFWVHFRGSSVDVFELVRTDEVCLKFEQRRTFPLNHYGFCKATCWKDEKLVYPDYDDETNVLRIIQNGGREKCLYLSAKFLTDSFIKHQQREFNEPVVDATEISLFKGLLMGIEVVDEDRMFFAFEDSTISVFDLSKKCVVDCIKHPKYHQFLCWSVEDALLLVSVVHQVFLMSYDKDTMKLRVCSKIKRSESINCVAICFLKPEGENVRFAGALSDGLIEVYSLHRIDYSFEIVYRIDFHAGNSIMCMKTQNEDHNDNLMVVGCLGKKLALYRF